MTLPYVTGSHLIPQPTKGMTMTEAIPEPTGRAVERRHPAQVHPSVDAMRDCEEANKQLRADLAAAKRQNRALRALVAELVAVTDDLPAKGGTPVPVAPRNAPGTRLPWGDDTRGMGE